ncbi:MAG: hypothetical protein ACLFWL_08065 [Candidatus Brocadiia bacterium]
MKDDETFISAVGSDASGHNRDSKLQDAENEARAELLRKIQGYTRAALEAFVEDHHELIDPQSRSTQQFIENVAVEVGNALLRQVPPHDTWQDKKKKTIYVMYRLPVNTVNRRVREKSSSVTERLNPFPTGQKEKALAELEHFLDSLLRQRLARASAKHEKEESGLKESPPSWLVRGEDKEFPRQDFLHAIGLADTHDAAKEAAKTEMHRHFMGTVRTLRRRIALKIDQNVFSRSVAALEGADKLLWDESELPDISVPKFWHDEVTKTYYALAIIDRSTAKRTYSRLIEEALADATELSKSGAAHYKADNYVKALSKHLEAFCLLQKAVKYQLAAIFLTGEETLFHPDKWEQIDVARCKESLNSLVKEFAVSKVSGDRQWNPGHEVLQEPLVASLHVGKNKTPVPDQAMRFYFKKGAGSLDAPAKTDKNGRIACVVKDIKQASRSRVAIRCEMDLTHDCPHVNLNDIEVPGVVFRAALRRQENTRIAVFFRSKDSQDLDTARDIAAHIRETLKKAGYSIVDADAMPPAVREGKLAADASVDKMAQAFRPVKMAGAETMLLICAGKSDAKTVETRETSYGKLHFVNVPATLRVIDSTLPPNSVIATLEACGKDAHTDSREKAVERARVKTAEILSRKLLTTLNNKFAGAVEKDNK